MSRENTYWGSKLADDYKSKTGCDRSGIRLPARDNVLFEGEKQHVTITMGQKAILENLQTNAAAFEAWSVALRVWSEVREIDLIWKRSTDIQQPHYQRFLYRAKRFESLFPDWFRVSRPELLEDAGALADEPLYLNVAGSRKLRTNRPGKAEAELEKHLLRSQLFRDYFGLTDKKLDRQIPVGLFRVSVNASNRLFTGGKSAIDIVGTAGGVLWLFELKAGKNIPAGILSELLFYVNVMRDAIGPKPRFVFDKRAVGAKVHPEDISRCSRIEAVLLGEKLHPLIGHADVITCLNEAARRNWNVSRDSIPVNFRGVTLKANKGRYFFTDMEAG